MHTSESIAAPQTLSGVPEAPSRRLWIETVGCQMNVLDSELVVAALRRQGWQLTTSPAEADAVFYNTCSVRQHAED